MTADDVSSKLTARLAAHVGTSGVGHLCTPGTSFTTGTPDTVRTPDIAFLRRDRLPESDSPPAVLMPDLVVDILSPGDRPLAIQARAGEWLAAGTSLVWVVDPRRRTVHVYRADGTEEFIGSGGLLDGEEMLPGFSCPLSDIL
jgi:Uma2 family endonuclease